MNSKLEGRAIIGSFSDDGKIPQRVNVISAKWAFAWKTDSDGLITEATTSFIVRGFR